MGKQRISKQRDMVGLEEFVGKVVFPSSRDPVIIELNRLENQLKDKERELGVAHKEIKALKSIEILKDKAVMELSNEMKRLEEKLRAIEKLLEHKNLEVKKLIDEKKEALAAQFVAEATLSRVHATLEDEDYFPVEAIVAPLESDIRMYRNEIQVLQEDKKALERVTKSKEAALVEAQKILRSSLERALIVENVQNENFELKRNMEILQEENKILENTNRQKVVEVYKLSQTVCELEEGILAGGTTANVVRDYQRQVSELNEEKRTLERELARARVSANRVATVVANEWKDDNDKVMPVKQWLEERKFLRGEIQRFRDKLAISERTAKAEAHIKDKLKLRLKTLEDGFKHVPSLPVKQPESSEGTKRRSTSQPRSSLFANKNSVLQQPNSASEGAESARNMKRMNSLKTKFVGGDNLVRKNLWASRSKFFDDFGKENTERNRNLNVDADKLVPKEQAVSGETTTNGTGDVESQNKGDIEDGVEDLVSGFLFDRLQKEVINLRKSHVKKDGLLNARNDEIKMLMKKIDVLTKSMEVKSKKRRQVSAKEKEVPLVNSEANGQKSRNVSTPKRAAKHLEATRTARRGL